MAGSGKFVGIGIIVGIVIGLAIGFGTGIDDTDSVTTSVMTTENPQLSGEVKIGLILPLSGDLATHGEENWEGSKLGVVDFNKYLFSFL